MRISDFCLVVAALCALTGMGLGITMGIAQDFTLSPAHAHLNLLGWVTLALYGLWHRASGRTGGLLGWLQVGTAALGAVLMSGGLAAYLSGMGDGAEAVVIAGSFLALIGMLLFLFTVLAGLRDRSRA